MPVRMRNGASSSFSSATTSSCSRSRSAVQPVRDLQPGRVIGEREVLVPERARLLGHRADRVAAVGPVGVHVQVALELRAQRLARRRCPASPRARAASRGTSASPRRAPRRSPPRSCRRCPGDPAAGPSSARNCSSDSGHAGDLARGPAERLLAVRRRAAPHQQVGDALECLDGRHAPTVPSGGGFYGEQVLPRLDRPDARRRASRRRSRRLHGDIVEIGSAPRLRPFLPPTVHAGRSNRRERRLDGRASTRPTARSIAAVRRCLVDDDALQPRFAGDVPAHFCAGPLNCEIASLRLTSETLRNFPCIGRARDMSPGREPAYTRWFRRADRVAEGARLLSE